MSEEQVQEDGQEPSMEDILASIRRILAEDEDGEGAAASEGGAEEEMDMAAAMEAPEPEPEEEMDMAAAMEAPEPEPTPPPVAAAPPPPPVAAPPPPPVAAEAPPPPTQPAPVQQQPAAHEIFELTQDMVSHPDMMSGVTMQASTDLLGDLARAIIDRRDMRVTSEGTDANITLEGIVREMLNPLLREWLDRNLPYLIERLVKKEIDQMVNRAQRLDDNF